MRNTKENPSSKPPTHHLSSTVTASPPDSSDIFVEPVDVKLLNLTNDNDCNSEDLRKIISKVTMRKFNFKLCV